MEHEIAAARIGARPSNFYLDFGKRCLDVCLAVPVAIPVVPVAVIVALLIKAEDGGPVFFRQERIGRDGRPFTVLKFRSMPVGTAEIPSANADSLPTTRVGKVLRRGSLDEIPQVFNVIMGDMSLVGPRPPLPAQSRLIDIRRANKSLGLRPGLTGLAQINAFDGMSDNAKAAWDGEYLRRASLLVDIRILLRTITYLARRPPQY